MKPAHRVAPRIAAAVALALLWAGASQAAEVARGWVRLSASFEGDLILMSDAGPLRPRVLGAPAFAKGLRGKSLCIGRGAGGAEVRWPAGGGIDLTRPGSLSLWATGGDGKGGGDVLPLVSIRGSKGPSLLVEREGRQAGAPDDQLLAGIFGLPGGRRTYLRAKVPRWRDSSWHLLVLSWDAVAVTLSIDGGEAVPAAAPEALSAFPSKLVLSVGGPAGERAFADELRVYGRPLHPREIAELWQTGSSQASGRVRHQSRSDS